MCMGRKIREKGLQIIGGERGGRISIGSLPPPDDRSAGDWHIADAFSSFSRTRHLRALARTSSYLDSAGTARSTVLR